jgi:hypothetical protein
MKAYIHTKCRREDGSYDCYQTTEVPVKTVQAPTKGQTLCGYGKALPTQYMVFYNNRWQRVKVVCFANAGTAYIGEVYSPCLTVDIYPFEE